MTGQFFAMIRLAADRMLSSQKTHRSSQFLRIALHWDTCVQLQKWLASDNRSVWEAEFVLRKLAVRPQRWRLHGSSRVWAADSTSRADRNPLTMSCLPRAVRIWREAGP